MQLLDHLLPMLLWAGVFYEIFIEIHDFIRR